MSNIERRVLQREINLRKIEDGEGQMIDGMASLFNHSSRLIAENGKIFYEVIRTGAFDAVLQREDLNVLALVNHDNEKMLGRSTSGTLKLTVTEEGLRYEILAPNTQLGNDTLEMLERGDFYESSFGYIVRTDSIEWSKPDQDGIRTRYINEIYALTDVSIVRNGAFSNTDVAIRELSEVSDSQEEEKRNLNKYFELKTKLLSL